MKNIIWILRQSEENCQLKCSVPCQYLRVLLAAIKLPEWILVIGQNRKSNAAPPVLLTSLIRGEEGEQPLEKEEWNKYGINWNHGINAPGSLRLQPQLSRSCRHPTGMGMSPTPWCHFSWDLPSMGAPQGKSWCNFMSFGTVVDPSVSRCYTGGRMTRGVQRAALPALGLGCSMDLGKGL